MEKSCTQSHSSIALLCTTACNINCQIQVKHYQSLVMLCGPSSNAYTYTCNVVAGTLPDTWADTGAFPALSSLTFWNSPLNGTLPVSWARPGALPSLISLELGGCSFHGTLPAEWATPAAFQRLLYLHLTNCSITGMLLQGLNVPSTWFLLRQVGEMQYLNL